MFIVISFPTKTIKNAENLGVSFWIPAREELRKKIPVPKHEKTLLCKTI